MAPNLVKSASMCSLDLSAHHLAVNAQAQVPIDPSPYPPLTSVDVAVPANDDHKDSVFGSGMQQSGSIRRTPSMLFEIIVEEEAKKATHILMQEG